MKRLFALLLACVAVIVVVAGCGGGSDDNSSDSGNSGNADTKAQPAPKAEDNSGSSGGASSGPQVTMKDIKFNPGTIKVKAGKTVTWTNDDSVGHDVTAGGFNSGGAGNIEPGKTFTHKFAKAGSYKYVCSVHPGMKGTIKVTK
jgi:plastocyanin